MEVVEAFPRAVGKCFWEMDHLFKKNTFVGFHVSQKDQVNFIYSLFKEFGHKEYGGFLEKGTRDRIRNMQENAINSLKIDL